MSKREGVKRHENGLIAVEQGVVSGWRITYNPDDERYYVDGAGKDYSLLRNAKQWARMNPRVNEAPDEALKGGER